MVTFDFSWPKENCANNSNTNKDLFIYVNLGYILKTLKYHNYWKVLTFISKINQKLIKKSKKSIICCSKLYKMGIEIVYFYFENKKIPFQSNETEFNFELIIY